MGKVLSEGTARKPPAPSMRCRFILLEGGKVAWDGADLAELASRCETDASA